MPYEFTQEAFQQFSQDVIAANGDQATLTSLLADMQGTFTDNIGIAAKQTKDLETLNAEADRLRKANMDLFLRVGTQAEQASKPSDDGQGAGGNSLTVEEYMHKIFDKQEDK